MDKIKYLTILVIVLSVLNAATLALIWLRPLTGSRPRGGKGEDPGVVLARQLGFTTEQSRQFEHLRSVHQQQMKYWSDSLKTLKEKEYRLLIGNDPAGAGEVIRAIGEVHRQVEQASFDHFSQALQLCTPEQRQLYGKMLYRAITEVPRPSRGRAEDGRQQEGPGRQQSDDRQGSTDDRLSPQPGRDENTQERTEPAQDDVNRQKTDGEQRRPPRQGPPPGDGN